MRPAFKIEFNRLLLQIIQNCTYHGWQIRQATAVIPPLADQGFFYARHNFKRQTIHTAFRPFHLVELLHAFQAETVFVEVHVLLNQCRAT